MIKKFKALNMYYKVAILSAVVTVIILLATMFLFFIGYSEIPQGIALGSLVGILSYVLLGIVDQYESKKGKNALAIVVSVFRFLLLAAVIVLTTYLYYKLKYYIFNVFALVGGYMINLIILIIVARKEK